MLAFDDIQHILLTRAPGLTGRYESLSFCSLAGGRARLAAVLDKVYSVEAMRASIDIDKRWATVALTRHGLRALGGAEPSLASFPEECQHGIAISPNASAAERSTKSSSRAAMDWRCCRRSIWKRRRPETFEIQRSDLAPRHPRHCSVR